jgi:SAM-dependent methyltransferase
VPRRECFDEVRSYYERILPFYEKESVARAHLAFWRGLARQWRPRRILEIGAGLGRVTAALSRHAPAVGIDISVAMLAAAGRQRPVPPRARFVAADMRCVGFDCEFDLMVAPSDPFSHLTALADRRTALRCVAHQLSPGGRFVLEGLYRRRRESEILERRIRHASGVLHIREAWRPVGAANLWKASYRYRDRRPGAADRKMEASFVARAWEPRKIRGLFSSCGLTIDALWGDFDRRPFSKGASRLVVVARRRVDGRRETADEAPPG